MGDLLTSKYIKIITFLFGVISLNTRRALAQNQSDSNNTIIDIIITSLRQFITELIKPLRNPVEDFGNLLLETIVSTPYPDSVIGRPTNLAWPELYDFYWNTIIPLSLLIMSMSFGLVILLESTSYLFSSYHESKLKRRFFSGLIGILSWWWLASLSLQFTNGLTRLITPKLSDLTLFEAVSLGGVGILITALTLISEIALFILVGLIYLSRHLMIYLFVLLMPVLISLWVPGVGPFKPMSRFMEKLAGFYVPFLFMTIPVAPFIKTWRNSRS